jgi:hypothetical protein
MWGSKMTILYFIFLLLTIKLYISKNMWHSAARCPSKPAYSPCFVLFFVSMYVGWHYIPFGIQSEAEWSKEKSREIVRWELAISRHCDKIRYLFVVEKKKSCRIYIYIYIYMNEHQIGIELNSKISKVIVCNLQALSKLPIVILGSPIICLWATLNVIVSVTNSNRLAQSLIVNRGVVSPH